MILVTGSQGMVGSYVEEIFGDAPLHLTNRQTMDVTDFAAVERVFEEVKPSAVLHLAAATDVDRCETEAEWAYKTNVIGTQNVVAGCQRHKALMIYISTGGLFSGEGARPYNEFDPPNPINVYAKTKWEGEKVVQNLCDRYFIVRAGWMIGGKEKDKKFVSKMVDLCHKQDTIRAVNDKIGTLTYAKDLLTLIRQLLKTSFYGVYHVANEGICSRFDIAREIAKFLKSPVNIQAVSSTTFPLPAPRARSEAIASYKLPLMGFKPLRTWQEALASYLDSWLAG